MRRLLHRFWRRRVPVILQMSPTECGAACLAMILSYCGRRTRLSECRDRCGAGRDGLSAQALVMAARQYGLVARAFRLTAEQMRAIELPAIVLWKSHHFVIAERWSGTRSTL